MSAYFAYARVSTPRQGKGVSLPEQKEAIERYAKVNGLEIARWFEERESASRQGRPEFNEMLRLLQRGAIKGVIIHKIDRSVRNMEDWSDVCKLVEAGVEVHSATENVDMQTVAGRLSADIIAVFAAHYSRNLREEVKKGIYGRLKQGYYPFGAPIGYLNQGGAKLKIPDPQMAPLVREAFQLYHSGQFSLQQLAHEMHNRGLRNRSGTRVSMNGLVTILKNPFYMGLIRIRKTAQMFSGSHEPLVSTDIFKMVQALLAGKRVDSVSRHVFQFSRIATCASCGYSLIAERKKGHVYYRCHNRPFKSPSVCPPTSVREESIDQAIINCLADVDLTDEELTTARTVLRRKRNELEQERAAAIQAQQLQLDRVESRLATLMDLLVDGTVDKTLFSEKQNALLVEKVRAQAILTESRAGSTRVLEELENTVELAKSPSMLYKAADSEKRRELVKALLSNVMVSGKNIEITLAVPFRIIRERDKHIIGAPIRGTCRTWEDTIHQLHNTLQDRPTADNLKKG